MERKIGEIFEYNGEWYQCVKSDGTCNGCVGKFQPYSFCNGFKECIGKIFKKLEKVGEPYTNGCKLFQRYKLFTPTNELVNLEIKQNKEDMEEKNNGNTPLNVLTDKYVNGDICYDDFEKEVKTLYSCKGEIKPTLKPFDLQKAKAGKPVCTRDGRKARIICFDQKDIAPIVGLVTGLDGKESIYAFYKDGRVSSQEERVDDLMMLPKKKEGWINVYALNTCYSSKEEAEANIDRDYENEYVRTVKINWEE